MSADIDALLDSVWSEVSEEVRKALDTLSAAASSVLEHETARLEQEIMVMQFKRDVLKTERERRD